MSGGAASSSLHVPLHAPLIWRLPVLVESAHGYRSLCRLVTRMKLAAAKGQGALTVRDLDGHVEGLVAIVGRPMLAADRHGVAGLLDQIVGVFGRAQVVRGDPAAPHARRGSGQPHPRVGGRGLSRADPGHQRRAVRHARRPSAVRRADVHPAWHHARACGASPRGQRRALPEVAEADAGALQRSAAGAGQHACAGRSSRLHARQSRLPLPGLSGARRRDADLVPAAHHRGGRALALPAAHRRRRSGRSRANSI